MGTAFAGDNGAVDVLGDLKYDWTGQIKRRTQ